MRIDYLNAGAELVAAALLFIPLMTITLSGRERDRATKRACGLLGSEFITLLLDAATWIVTWRPCGYVVSQLLLFATYSGNAITIAMYTRYLVLVAGREKPVSRIFRVITCFLLFLGVTLWVAMIPTDWNYVVASDGTCVGGKYFIVPLLPIAATLVANGTLAIVRHKAIGKRGTVSFVCFSLLPLIAMSVSSSYDESIMMIACTGSAMALYCTVHVRQAEAAARQEIKLTDLHSRTVFQRLQPEFIYNGLNSIYRLCDENPREAQESVSNFSDYLRMNMDAMRLEGMVPMNHERLHTEKYLSIVRLRYRDRLKVVWDLQATEFFLPMLTLQPLVENAVVHGIATRPEGGTITVASWENETQYFITVRDDGMGFDTEKPAEENEIRSTLGVSGVRTRVRSICEGELHVQSIPGVGTEVKITIPKRRK